MLTTAALAPRSRPTGACGRGRRDPSPPAGNGPRAPRWSPAATGQRTRAAWSRDPCRAYPSAPAPRTGGLLTWLRGRDTSDGCRGLPPQGRGPASAHHPRRPLRRWLAAAGSSVAEDRVVGDRAPRARVRRSRHDRAGAPLAARRARPPPVLGPHGAAHAAHDGRRAGPPPRRPVSDGVV